jgi:hypothetical protein
LASSLDIFDCHIIFEHPRRIHTWATLFALPGSGPSKDNRDSGFLGQVLLNYLLLDTLVSCNDWTNHPKLSNIDRTTIDFQIPSTLKSVIKLLDGWPNLILRAKHACATERPVQQPPRFLNMQNTIDLSFYVGTKNLEYCIHHFQKSNWNRILTNIYAVAFVLQWHSPVSSIQQDKITCNSST